MRVVFPSALSQVECWLQWEQRQCILLALHKKGQITTLIAICASGRTIPPMHIFPGKRFSYNPMEGGVDGAYFGRLESGWINTELFYS